MISQAKPSAEIVFNTRIKESLVEMRVEEWGELEDSIRNHGVRDAVVVWDDGERLTMVDGHARYKIARQCGVPFKIHKMRFDSIDEAIAFRQSTQVGRRNLTPSVFKAMLGKLVANRGDKSVEDIARENGVSTRTANRAGAREEVTKALKSMGQKKLADKLSEAPQKAVDAVNKELRVAKSPKEVIEKSREVLVSPPKPTPKPVAKPAVKDVASDYASVTGQVDKLSEDDRRKLLDKLSEEFGSTNKNVGQSNDNLSEDEIKPLAKRRIHRRDEVDRVVMDLGILGDGDFIHAIEMACEHRRIRTRRAIELIIVSLVARLPERNRKDVQMPMFCDAAQDIPLPASIDTPKNREAWNRWCKNLDQKGVPLSGAEAEAELSRLGRCKPSSIPKMIEQALRQRQTILPRATQLEAFDEAPTMEEVMGYAKASKSITTDGKLFFLTKDAKGWEGVSDWRKALHAWNGWDEKRAKDELRKKPNVGEKWDPSLKTGVVSYGPLSRK